MSSLYNKLQEQRGIPALFYPDQSLAFVASQMSKKAEKKLKAYESALATFGAIVTRIEGKTKAIAELKTAMEDYKTSTHDVEFKKLEDDFEKRSKELKTNLVADKAARQKITDQFMKKWQDDIDLNNTAIGQEQIQLGLTRSDVRNAQIAKDAADKDRDIVHGMMDERLLLQADNPFQLSQEIYRAEDREQMWGYACIADANGQGVRRLRGDQKWLLDHGLEETETWKALCLDPSPLGMSSSKFQNKYPNGKIKISHRDATLWQACSKLADMIGLPADSFSPRFLSNHHDKRSAETAFTFDEVSASDEDMTQASAKKAKVFMSDLDQAADTMDLDHLEMIQKKAADAVAVALKRKSME